jgi:DNA-binding CsgD family transcriptional regulator
MMTKPVFRDFFRPRGYGGGVATAIFAPSGDTLVLHAECGIEQAPVDRETVLRLDRLRPHFARAALLSARLEMERVKAAAKALELIGLPAAILGRGGRMMQANALLTAMIPDVVQDRPFRVAFAHPEADALLASALAGIGAVARERTVSSIPLPAGEGHPPIVMHLLPIRGAAHDVFSLAAAVLIATPVVPLASPTADVVQGLFDLTPAEARLAALIAGGSSPGEASGQLGVSTETARTTLKRIFAKTGTHRQVDLVRMLTGRALGPR